MGTAVSTFEVMSEERPKIVHRNDKKRRIDEIPELIQKPRPKTVGNP